MMRRKFNVLMLITAALIGSLACLLVVWKLFFAGPYSPPYPELRQRIEKIGIHRLQNWVVAYVKSAPKEARELTGLSEAQIAGLPEFVRELHPQYIRVGGKSGGSEYVEFDWGGGFGHWGVRIGPPNFSQPTGTTKGDEYRSQVERWWPGFYGWQFD